MRAGDLPRERLARAAGHPGDVAVEEVEVGVEDGERLEVGTAAHADRLDHLAAGSPRGLGAERRALVAVELDHRQPDRVRGPGQLIERRVDEHADDLGPPLDRGGDLGRRVELATANSFSKSMI